MIATLRRGPLPGLAALSLTYVLSQFFRIAIGVVAPEIAADLALDPARLGILSAAWFVAFAAAQIPVGVALDRFGPRLTIAVLLAFGAAGCAVFAMAQSLAMAVLGQLLIGLGCAPMLMGTLVVIARFYEPARFASTAAIVISFGGLGTLLGATPLALAAELVGWRGAFLGMAAAMAAALALVLLAVRDGPPGTRPGAAGESLGQILKGVGRVIANRNLWPLLPMAFFAYAVVVTLRGLWLGPYLDEVFGLDPVGRGQVLLLVSLSMVIAPLIFATLERRLDSRRGPAMAGCALTIAALAGLALAPAASLALAAALAGVVGLTGMTYSLIMAQGRRFLGPQEIGRGLTLLNGVNMAGAAVVQIATGAMVAALRALGLAPSEIYGWLFAALALALAGALLVYRRSRDLRVSSLAG
ncbi:MFS transporter [Marinimicrococcus flavescens]|uniref:MFS transporter n=1 Tax=Marinimicrococcus flavescens TaxID=3031815 RepID=A0AAP3UY63_9PROT|nr:MFS transporter [Marinimicrococcus flavescens]